MKRTALRLLPLLLALLLTGVFAVQAEGYSEYSSGLSVVDARAVEGYDTSVLVCIDGTWTEIAGVNSTTASLRFDSSYNRTWYVARVSDLAATDVLGQYGFTAANYAAGDKTLPYAVGETMNTNSTCQDSGWPNNSYVGMGRYSYAAGYRIFYTPAGTNSTGTVAATNLAQANSFYTISIAGLTEADAAAVDYGTAYNTAQGRMVFTGDDVTITVPAGADYDWDYGTTGYTSVNVSRTDAGTVFAFTGVTAPLTLTATEAVPVNVTVQQLGMDGAVLASQTYVLDKGATLPAEALSGYDSQYKWYDADGNQITSPATLTFTEDTTITTRPATVTSGVGATFYVYLDGSWQQVGATDLLYGPYQVNGGNRYLLAASQLEEAFGSYGFTVESYNSSADRRFGYSSSTGTTMWADTTPFEYYGEWMLPLSPGIKQYAIYYLPDNTSYLNNAAISSKAADNAFWTITLTEAESGATTQVVLEEETVLADWLAEMAGTTLPGFTYPVSAYEWTATESGAALTAQDTAETVHSLTGSIPVVTVTLVDEAGNLLGTVENVMSGSSISLWLENNDGMLLSDGLTVHDYSWELPNDTAIGTQVFRQDTTLVGTKKPIYTVTFVDCRPGSTESGGSFINASPSYTTIEVTEGDCIPASFIARMRQNIEVKEDWAFVEWQWEGNEGYLVMDQKTPIVKDTIVWADYTQEVYVRFWTDRNKTTQFEGAGLENQPVGERYEGAVPDADAVLAVAPAEGMRFRYWYDLNSGVVFTPATDQVNGNLDLYPVFERSIFDFRDAATGKSHVVLYDGTALNYEEEERENCYFAGLEVSCSDGSTFVIPNGTVITREYLIANNIPVPTPVDGRYIIPATPVYRQQRTVVYHTGADAQFIIYGAEDQENYTVTVDNSVVLLGALDIINVASPIGLALEGWATTPDATTAQFGPNATYEGGTELDMLVGAGETVHLYPVWAQQENTVAITFVSNYPADAVDADGNALQPRSYTVYIKEGSKPTMPTQAKTGVVTPSNTLADGTLRYTLAGWSLDQDGHLDDTGKVNTQINGTYVVGSEYQHTVTENKTFYGIWIDRQEVETGITAAFHIRTDGILPIEPGQFPTSAYLPGACAGSNAWFGKIKQQINVVNDVARVEANVLEEPDVATILSVLQNNTNYRNQFPQILEMTVADYGTEWWIDWYACKNVSCPTGKHYHVDGRVRFADQVELNYHPNGGTNVPAGTVHQKETSVTVNKTNVPTRENFIFIGWDEDPAAKVPDYPATGLTFPSSPNLDDIWMDTDKDLYAIWQPMEITIPMDDDFRGQKYEQTNDGLLTPPQEGRAYQFTIEAIELPEGAAAYAKRTVTCLADGTFTFPQIHVQVEGMYVFEVREVIGDLAVQYDTAVYRLTINIVESDYGLGIAGYSFTRNNKVINVADNNVDNVVFTFTNRTDIRSVTASKVWDDADNQDGLRPASVHVTLRRRGDSIFAEEANLTAAVGWTWTWEELDIKDAASGAIYEYYIVEDAVPQYDTLYSGDMNSGLIVTNTYQPKHAEFRVDKDWQDADNANGMRPETVAYTLVGSTADGAVVSTTQSGPVGAPWSYTFADMPLYSAGEQLYYTLTEEAVSGYTTTIVATSDGSGGLIFGVTNTLTAVNATVTKAIAGNAAYMDDAFAFTAQVLDAAGNPVTDLTAGEGYTVDSDGTIRFTLGHQDSVELKLLPLGGTLVLTEAPGDYTVTFAPEGTASGTGVTYAIEGQLDITVTNTREAPVLTGVALDSTPYLLLLGLSLLGLAGQTRNRKRRAE